MGNVMPIRLDSEAKSISKVSGETLPVLQKPDEKITRAAEVHLVMAIIESEKAMNPELIERCNEAVKKLTKLARAAEEAGDMIGQLRIMSKVEGIRLVLSYAREYDGV